MFPALFVIALLFVAPSVATVDEVYLVDGRRLEGRVVRLPGGDLRVESRFGAVEVEAGAVVDVIERETVEEEYRRRAAALAAKDEHWRPEGERLRDHLDLATWCESRSYRAGVREHAEEVVAADPDCREARALLGHEKVGEQWMPRGEAQAARGLVRDSGEWVTAAEAQRRAEERVRKEARRRIQRRANALMRRMASPSDRARDGARDDLLRLARDEELWEIVPQVRRAWHHYRDWWANHQSVVLELRTGMSEVTGTRELRTSLGRGTPVRLQLPRLRTVSLGTTVAVPIR